MSDIDTLTHNEEASEIMEKPNASKSNKFVFIGFAIAILAVVVLAIFDSGSSEEEEDGLRLETRSDSDIETGENKPNVSRRKNLEIPEFDDEEKVVEEPSLSDQLLQDEKEKSLDSEKLKIMLIQEPVDKAKSGASYVKEAILQQEAERLRASEDQRQRKEDRMKERMSAKMSDTNKYERSARTGSYSDKALEKRDQIDKVRRQALALQSQIDNKQSRLSGLSAFSGSRNEASPITQLIELPTSQAKTVEAGNLKDVEWLITEGTIIQAVIESGINSNLPGKIRAITTLPVRSYTGNAIIIPRGSELIGQYSAAAHTGDPRLFVIWTRLITPDGISVNLDSQGVDPLGVAGIGGKLNTHFFKRFGSSLMLSIVGGAAQKEAENSNQVNAIADSFNRSAEIALENSINIPPTIQRNQGASIAVFVNSDINFKNAMISSKTAQKRIEKMSPNYREKQAISYDRVFDTRELSYEERALLANRFIADNKISDEFASRPKPYTAKSGESLRATIKKWASLSNYIIKWDVEDKQGNHLDWNLPTDLIMHSDLYTAVGRLLDAYRESGVPLTYQFFNENDVLIIRMGESK